MSTNPHIETARRKINLIADKYTDAVDRLLKLQIARTREYTKAAKFAKFAIFAAAAASDPECNLLTDYAAGALADAAASDPECKRLTAYAEGALAEAAETDAEIATAALELIAIAGTLEAYGLPADPEILRMAHAAADNH